MAAINLALPYFFMRSPRPPTLAPMFYSLSITLSDSHSFSLLLSAFFLREAHTICLISNSCALFATHNLVIILTE